MNLIKRFITTLFALLFILICTTSVYSQVNVTSVGASYYFVVIEDDTISQHTTLHRAMVSALNSMHPNPQIVQDYRLNFQIDPWEMYIEDPPFEVIYDTVYVPLDTVFVEIRDTVFVEVEVPVPTDTIFMERSEGDILRSVDWEHTITEGGSQQIVIEAEAYGAFTDFMYWCDGEPVWWNSNLGEPGHNERWQEDSQGNRVQFRTHPKQEDGLMRDVVNLECLDEVKFTVYTYSSHDHGGWRTGYLGSIPVHLFRDSQRYFTDFSEYVPAEWEVIWGNMSFYVNNETLFIEQPQNIARLRWNRIPEHTNARIRVVEELHESHTTGVHASLRSSGSPSPRRGVESYVNLQGVGISYFLDGAWRNPINFPYEWEAGDIVEYIMDVSGDIVRLKIWDHEEGEEPESWLEFSHEEIGEIMEGYFSVGATGAGTYIIHEIEVHVYN